VPQAHELIWQEADLPPDRPYLFGYHPHGIIGMYAQFGFGLHKADRNRGAFATFATEGTGFSDYFPGILPHLLTLGKLPHAFAHNS